MSEEKKTIGPYEVIEQIARDRTGVVFKATDPKSGKVVAIKMLPAELSADEGHMARFREQVEAVEKLDHPHVVRILDSGEDEGRAYFVMEWVEGMPLSKMLKRRRLSLTEAFGVFKNVALALDHAHSRDVLHLDLSPRNILVSENLSVVKLGDFGISRAASMAGESETVTATSMSRGALNYLAPEQALANASPDRRADIYSLGVLFYELLTGTVPVGRFTLPSRINSQVPAEVDPVVLKCLEGDPAQRYDSIETLLAHVDQLEDRLRLGLASELRGLGRSFRRPTTQLARHRGTLAVLVLVTLLIVAGVAAWSFRDRLFGGPTGPAVTATPLPGGEPPAESFAVPLDEVEPPPAATEGADEETEGQPPESEATSQESTTAPERQASEQPSGPTPAEMASKLYESAAQSSRAGRLDEALATIERVQKTYPGTRAAVDALFLRARLEEARKEFDAAMATYTQIGSLTASSREERAMARYRFAKAVLDSETPNRRQLALGVFDEIARAYPQTDYAPLALAAKATLEEADNVRVDTEEYGRKTPAAFLTSLALIERYPDHPTAERAFWVVGSELEDRKEWTRAADAFWQLGERFPENRYDGWWRAGQVLDKRLDDTTRALEAYRHVPEGSEHYDDAQKRIARLTK